jgi:hypothetical protein
MCPVCEAVSSSVEAFEAHLKTSKHKPRKLLSGILGCGVCGLVMKNSEEVAHRELHPDVFAFPCDVCGKRFEVLKGMEQHRRSTHPGVPYVPVQEEEVKDGVDTDDEEEVALPIPQLLVPPPPPPRVTSFML